MQALALAASAERPNFLFILTEDQGAHLSFVGTPGLETPSMDSIAASGVYFREAFVNYPVCSASKANIYTGLHSHANGVPSNTINFFQPAETLSEGQLDFGLYKRLRVPEATPTLVELLHNAGYKAGVTHKLHIAPNHKFPYDRWTKTANGADLRGLIAAAKRDQAPWLYFCNIEQPHRPFRNSDDPAVELTVDRDAVEVPAFMPDTPEVRTDWAEYLDAVEVADRRIGRVLNALEASGERDNTVVVFLGDHGPAYHRGKVSPYDFGLRVPLAIAGPGIRSGLVNDELVSAIDLMPTILGLAGTEPPSVQHGMSLLPLLRGESRALPGRDFMVAEVHHGTHTTDDGMQERSIYDGRRRLIYREGVAKPRDFNADLRYWATPGVNGVEWRNRAFDSIVKNKEAYPLHYRLLDETCSELGEYGPARLELYDLKNDPYETQNLASLEEMQPALKRLLRGLVDHAVQTGDADISIGLLRDLIDGDVSVASEASKTAALPTR